MTDLLRIAVPLSVWLGAFSLVYGLEGLVCSDRWPGDLAAGRAALVAAWLAAVALQAGLLLALRSDRFASPSGFARGVSQGLALVALVATAWTLAPVAVATLCR